MSGPSVVARPAGVPLAALLAIVAVAALVPLGGALVVVGRSADAAVVAAAQRLCAATTDGIARGVEARIRVAESAIDEVQREIDVGILDASDLEAVLDALARLVVRHPELAEAAFTDPGGQVAAERRAAGGAVLLRRTLRSGEGFLSDSAELGGSARSAPRPAADPTSHATWRTPLDPAHRGRTLWSDLHRAQADADLPEASRRVVVAAQRSLRGARSAVLRVSVAPALLDTVSGIRDGRGDGPSGLRVFLADRRGRLIAPRGPGGDLEAADDGLRVPGSDVPADISAALALPAAGSAPGSGRAEVGFAETGGRTLLAAFRALPWSQDWVVGVVADQREFTRDLDAARRRLVLAFVAVAAAGFAAALLLLRAARRSVATVVEAAERMRAFDFSPPAVRPRSPVREVLQILDAVERSRASLRALGKFVPVDLVRRIHATDADPRPGGVLREVTVMFTDLEGFTGFAESADPGTLADIMAEYFGRMTAAVHSTSGVVDKFIGDSVMALWNAPEPVGGHASRACRAALACRGAEGGLLPPTVRTRIGIHTCTALVGNIGAPDRLNYTALGDGVNLASRLEGLNRHYGTDILVSEAAAAAAGAEFAFRRIDRVAVKGRRGGVEVFSLIGPAGSRTEADERYERGLDAYFGRDFAAALSHFAACGGDRPARVIAARCERLLRDPPPDDWDGTHAHGSK